MKRQPNICSSAFSKVTKGGGLFLFKRHSYIYKWFGSGFGSIFIHIIALFLLFLFIRGGTRGFGTGERQTDDIGIVFSDSSDSFRQENSSSVVSVTDENSPSAELNASSTTSNELHEALESYLPSNEIGLTESSADSGARETINAATTSEANNRTVDGGGQSVGFSGARGVGRKFVYVVDRSDSMGWNGGTPMRRAISDAIASVQSLESKKGASKFQVLVFNHEVEVFNGGTGLIDVNLPNKTRCARFLNSLVPSGGTSPEQALAVGLKMRPDVVFFLTDADEELSDQTLERIQTLRRQCKVQQICVVEFRKSTDPVKKTYRRLAGENGGSYVVRNIDAF